MSRSVHKNSEFKKRDKMAVSPSRRAIEHRQTLQDVMDFITIGDIHTHPFSDEYESGDITMVRVHG